VIEKGNEKEHGIVKDALSGFTVFDFNPHREEKGQVANFGDVGVARAKCIERNVYAAIYRILERNSRLPREG